MSLLFKVLEVFSDVNCPLCTRGAVNHNGTCGAPSDGRKISYADGEAVGWTHGLGTVGRADGVAAGLSIGAVR